MKKNIKNQKGAISLFVLLSMMFFMAFMLGAFTLVNRRNATQIEALSETQKIYSNQPTASEQYDSIFVKSGTSVVPITNLDQLKQAKTATDSNTKYKYLINGKVYTYEKGADFVLQNDIILDLASTVNGKKATGTGTDKLELYDYVLYNTTYGINLNGHSIYYQKKETDGTSSYWKLVCYQDLNDTTNGVFSTTSSSTNYYGKSYNAKTFSLLEDGIAPYKHNWGTATDGKVQNYEFLLMYSLDSNKFNLGANTYNRWRQFNNPKDDTSDQTSNTTVPGYTAVDVKITGNRWGGLTRNYNNTQSYFNGSIGSSGSWWYAIACTKNNWSDGTNLGIPSNVVAAKECLLFVRYK